MTRQISRDGPGPMVLRTDSDNGDVPLGSVLVDIYADREAVSIAAADSAKEELVRSRFNLYALKQANHLIRRCVQEYGRAQTRRGQPGPAEGAK